LKSTQAGLTVRGRWWQFLSPHRPWIYLVYLVVLFLPAFFGWPAGEWLTVSLLAMGVFLGLFVLAMVRRDAVALPAALATQVLGFWLLPDNPGAAVFIIYAAAMVARVRERRWQRTGLAMWVVALLAGCLLVSVPLVYAAGYFVFGAIIASATAWSARSEDREAVREELEADAAARAVEAERQRIARDLHDLLGHTLSVVTLKADLAGRVFDADPERAKAELAGIQQISRDALAEVREAVTGLRVRPLDIVADEIASRLGEAGLSVEVDLAPGASLPDTVTAAFGMVVREGATNVLRHAGARRVSIRLADTADGLRLSVADDGRGGVRFAGRGLDGLRDRLAQAGMRLETGRGLDGRGSEIAAIWPREGEAE
jgi:two-component system sensor histidine kinase DesK